MKLDSGAVLVILAIATFLFMAVGLAAQWRVSRNTTALTQYRETAQGWEGKARLQETEIADLKADARRKDSRISDLEGRVSVLQEALTGKASWEILVGKMSEALTLMGDTRTEVRQMHQIITGKQPPP